MKVGDNAPDFTLKDGDGNDWKLSEQRGKTVVLLFYPGDNTPVCTKQLCSVRDNWEDYRFRRVAQRFRRKTRFTFDASLG
jgi:peroxiredoxin Q/BCP